MVNYKKAGAVFEDEVKRGLALAAPWYFKIPDTQMLHFVNIQLIRLGMHPITFPKVPADFIAHGDSSKVYYIEAKNTYRNNFFISDSVKEHQLVIGCTVDSIGPHCDYRIVIHMKQHKRVFSIRPSILLDFLKAGRSSLNVNELHEHGEELIRYTESKHPTKAGAFVDFTSIIK